MCNWINDSRICLMINNNAVCRVVCVFASFTRDFFSSPLTRVIKFTTRYRAALRIFARVRRRYVRKCILNL